MAVEESNSVTLIDAASGEQLADIKVQGKNPEHAVFSPDGRWLLVSAEEAEQVDVIDVAARRQVGSIAVGLRPRGIGFSPDSQPRLRRLRTGQHGVRDRPGDARRRSPPSPAGKNANGIAVHPSGKQVYVSNGADGSVMVIDTARNAVTATIAVGKRPWNMALTPDGAKLYVANGRSNSVSVIDTAGARKLADIAVGELPWGVVIH